MKTLIILFTFLIGAHSSFAATTAQDIRPWPTNIIPYVVESDVPVKIKKDIKSAIDRINSFNIVKLIDKSAVKNFDSLSIVFTYKRNACSSTYGWDGSSATLVKVSESCLYGNILHEIMHSLGMVHEQLNPLKNFSINFNHISTAMEDQFTNDQAVALTAHDPDSIMHYSSFGFSICDNASDPKWTKFSSGDLPPKSCQDKNWQTQIDCSLKCATFLDSENKLILGQRKDLSPLDLEGLRKLYLR